MDPRALPPRLVIDPSLPPDVSVELRSSPHVLRLARSGWRMAPRNLTWLFVLPGFLLLLWMVTGTGAVITAAVGAGLFGLIRWLSVGSYNRATRRRLALAYEYANYYILPEDLDYPCQVLLRRAQRAAEAILGSQVHREGLIDTIDNRVTLPEEVWQIAQRLRKLSAMHAEHGKLVPRELPTGLKDAFKPYSTALDAAWTSLSKRVRNLEQYAKQVVKADRVFHAHRRLEALAARTPDYQELIADTVRDDMARAHLRELTDQAAHARKLFEESIHQARQAAGELLRPPRP
ncbi:MULTISPECIES: hypothetical protein [Nonomuraea]|uniref:5-bromo-4-chloroindolyl phosphate hydrolysis protein n=2 Tax=Nonomuraea TaxID=83681 RepID=A0ABW1BMK8_9ACTN|nr:MULTISPECIES: hypothetical protein [Nonomuraea]MDA0640843.1 hypothetical protein [Nonomuraea ferruginea]TXK39447.1 hypothetical protein FR742_07480 [Nonomuraea sp. C10]